MVRDVQPGAAAIHASVGNGCANNESAAQEWAALSSI
jgi:hypothetical protein